MNNLKVLNIVEDGLIVCGVAISLQQLYTIFGIILLAIQITLIVTKGVIKIVDLVKKKKYQKLIKVYLKLMLRNHLKCGVLVKQDRI